MAKKAELTAKQARRESKASRRVATAPIKYITEAEFSAIIRQIKVHEQHDEFGEFDGLKYDTIFKLALTYGLRRNEIVEMDVDDIDFVGNMIFVDRLKNGENAWHPMGESLAKQLKAWLKKRAAVYDVEAIDLGPLFPVNRRITNNGVKESKRISGHGIAKMFNTLWQEAKLKRRLTLHSLRHGSATMLLSHGYSLDFIQNLLGHKDRKSTELYAKLTDESKKAFTQDSDKLLESLSR